MQTAVKNKHIKSLKGLTLMEQEKKKKGLPGLYIAICCTVIAIGAAGFFAHRSTTGKTKDKTVTAFGDTEYTEEQTVARNDTAAAADEKAESEDSFEPPVISEPEKPEAADPAPVFQEQYAIDNPDVQAASVTVKAEDSGGMLDPVPDSAILTGFSDKTLLYNEHYHDWRTHNSIDIAADIGCSVCSAADGTVTETGTGSYGGYVVIEHNNGITATYAQLGDISVSEGDSVTAGDVIGTVGECRGENATESHLHYELIKGGKYVDPAEY